MNEKLLLERERERAKFRHAVIEKSLTSLIFSAAVGLVTIIALGLKQAASTWLNIK